MSRLDKSCDFIAVALLVAVWGSSAAAFSGEKIENVPNPLASAGKYVGDGASVLGPEYIDLINGLCRALKTATSAEMAVITVRDLGGITIEDFAEKLFKKFGIGLKGKDNGILILLALAERDVRIEVGYGLEPVITDAKSKMLMDEFAIPFMRNDQFSRGLFALAKATAGEIAKVQGASFDVPDPAVWPAQLPLPKPVAGTPKRASTARPSGNGAFLLVALTAGWGILGMGLVLWRFKTLRARAARARAISGANGVISVLWLGAGGGFIALLATGGAIATALLALLAPTAITIGQGFVRKKLRGGLGDYRLPCVRCGKPMDLTPEDQDDAFLTVEEAAEEKAGGMDYEVWKCASCGASERLSVKLNKASACPQCKRRTLTETRTTVVAATTSHGGSIRVDRKCANPKCNFFHSAEHGTPRLGSTSSSSGRVSGSSSHSSFGGGRSGGGGSTGHF